MTDANKLFFNCETCQSQHHNQQPQHNKMSLSKLATEVTEQYATAMAEAIESATKAEAETKCLKRKYEPDEPKVLMDKILQLSDDNGMNFMSVQIFTGEYMQLTLIPSARSNDNVPDWTFRPHRTGFINNTIDFGHYGMWQISIGDGCTCHDWLVHFDHKGVRITVVTDHNGDYMVGPDTMTIKEYTAPVTWTSSDDA